MFRYLIWDFDGTLFDTYPPLVRAIRQSLAEHDITVPEATIRALLADTLQHCMDTLCTEHALDPDAFAARIDHYRSFSTLAERPPFPGVIDLCERFRAAGGQNLIFTHRDRETLFALLDWHGARGLFMDVLTTEDGYARKPDPAGFLALVEKHDLPRESTLAVGDRALDVLAAQAAGLPTCLYAAEPAPGVRPDYVVASFDALAAILGLAEDAPADPDSDEKSTSR